MKDYYSVVFLETRIESKDFDNIFIKPIFVGIK